MTGLLRFWASGLKNAAVSLTLASFLVFFSPWAALADGVSVRPNFAQGKITLKAKDGSQRTLQVELARTDDEIAYGLMYLSDLPGTDGMLFRLPGFAQYAFWMKNTIMPLDIIYLDNKGAVVNLYANTKPLSTEHLYSSGPALMVLEVKAGMADIWAIGPGTIVTPPAGFLP